jgi:hypothetical protein
MLFFFNASLNIAIRASELVEAESDLYIKYRNTYVNMEKTRS